MSASGKSLGLRRSIAKLAENQKLKSYFALYETNRVKAAAFVERTPVLRTFFHRVPPRLFALILAVTIGLGSILFMWHKAGTMHKEHLYADIRRISNMEEIRIQIRQYALTNGRLPKHLQDMQSAGANPGYMRDSNFYDPETYRLMEYQIRNDDEYSLCATFSFSTQAIRKEVPSSGIDNPVWQHDRGHKCFPFTVPLAAPRTVK